MSEQGEMDEQVKYLMNESIPFDQQKVAILDQVTNMMYSTQPGNNSKNVLMANQILSNLKEQSQFWTNSQYILETSQSNNTKFLVLMILDEVVKTRWKIFPQNVKDNTKQYIMNQVIRLGMTEGLAKDLDKVLTKCNSIIVQILKHEWQTSWQTFIGEICNASLNNNQLCGNTFTILKMLSEEIYDHSKNSLTSKQTNDLKMQMFNDFAQIFELCKLKATQFLQQQQQQAQNQQVNQPLVKQSLMKNCLQTMHTYLSWIPLQYIFQQDLIQSILLPILDNPRLRMFSLQCFYEIAIIDIGKLAQNDQISLSQQLVQMFLSILDKSRNVLLPHVDNLQAQRAILEERDSTTLDRVDKIIRQLCLFYSGFLQTHFEWFVGQMDLNNHLLVESYRQALTYLVMFTEVKEDQIFKICVEFWHSFLNLKMKQQQNINTNNNNNTPLLLLGSSPQPVCLNNQVYHSTFQMLIRILIMRMAKPQEVLIVLDETGYPTREVMENTENNTLFELLRDILQMLCKLDWQSMRQIAMDQIDSQMNTNEWSFESINSISWAVGAISGHMPSQDEEKFFLIKVIKTLLNLVEKKKGKENKAVVASNIMYVVGQYPSFLEQNWNFLKTVVKKLFEFMHELFPGVQDMACNTFLRISQVCRNEFVKNHQDQQESYIFELIRKVQEETQLLNNQQKLLFFESLGHIIQSEPDPAQQLQQMSSLMMDLQKQFFSLLNDINDTDYSTLKNEDVLEFLQYFFKVNERMAFSIGDPFGQVFLEYQDCIINLYKFYSQSIQDDLQKIGNHVLNFSHVKKIRRIKKDIILIYESQVEQAQDYNKLCSQFCPNMLTLLQDYQSSADSTKEVEILTLFTKLVEKVSGSIQQAMPVICEIILTSNNMITQDFNGFPDHRINFYKFFNSVIHHSFQSIFQLNQDLFRTFINFILWAVKHEHYDIYDIGLDILFVVIQNVNNNYEILNMFYQIYYMNLLKDVLEVSIDAKHKNGIKKQSQILQLLFSVVESNQFVTVLDQNCQNNKQFVYQQLCQMLTSTFQNINSQQTEYFIQQLFSKCNLKDAKNNMDFKSFLLVLRDYLIKLSQFSDDLEFLYDKSENQLDQQDQQQG